MCPMCPMPHVSHTPCVPCLMCSMYTMSNVPHETYHMSHVSGFPIRCNTRACVHIVLFKTAKRHPLRSLEAVAMRGRRLLRCVVLAYE